MTELERLATGSQLGAEVVLLHMLGPTIQPGVATTSLLTCRVHDEVVLIRFEVCPKDLVKPIPQSS